MENNEHTPLLGSSLQFSHQMSIDDEDANSTVSADVQMELRDNYDEPGPSHLDRCVSFPATTAASVHDATGIEDARIGQRRRRPRRVRTRSEIDLRKARPVLVSPFMPQITTRRPPAPTLPTTTGTTQLRHHRQRSQSPGNCNLNTVSMHPSRPPRYGSLSLNASTSTAAPTDSRHQAQEARQKRDRSVGRKPTIPTVPERRESSSSSEDEAHSSSDSSSASSATRFSDLSAREWATIGMLAIANLCSTIAFSCIAPFFPGEAQLKGLNSSEIGMVFGVFELVMFILSPILGKYMSKIGSKRMFIAGLLITGIATILFGFLNFIPSGRLFFWSSMLIRCSAAFGDACFVTSSFAISVVTFPGRISTVVGVMETFAGLGFTLGPFIGAILYDSGGFQLPFLSLGSLLLLATVVSIFLVEGAEDDEEENEDSNGFFGMLKIPYIWIMIFAVVICAVSLSFFDPTLADHLKSFNLSTTMVGFIFLLSGGIYTISAPLIGLIVDRFNCSNVIMLFGSAATIVSMIFVGPSPILNMDKNLVVIALSLALFGVAAAALYIPSFQGCLNSVRHHGFEDNFHTYGCVSGIFQSAFAFGAFIGPTLGGLSVQHIKFPWTTSIIALINLIFVIVLCVFFALRQFYFEKPPPSSSSSSSSSTSSSSSSSRSTDSERRRKAEFQIA